jgi:hypothetical protein
MRVRGRTMLAIGALLGVATLISVAAGSSLAAARTKPLSCPKAAVGTWSFGVMADTQWIGADDGKNPNSVAVGIIRQLNSQFIADTTARILGGVNGSAATDSSGRALVKTVDTAWASQTRRDELTSNIVTLSGLADLGASRTDSYVLSVSYKGGAGILATRDGKGRWVNAVDHNAGGAKHFVLGPWKAKYGLGTFGYDAKSHTAWAVVNHNGNFAVARGFRMASRH